MVKQGAKIVSVISFLAILCIAFYQLQYAIKEQRTFVGKYDDEVIDLSTDPILLTNLARKKHLFEADLAGAEALLKRALSVNSYHVPAWLALAEVRNDQGDKESANHILEYSHQLTEGLKRWRWQQTLTAYQLGQLSFLPQELNFIIREVGGKERKAALTLAFSIWSDSADLVTNVGEENINHLLRYAIANTHVEHARNLWREIERKNIAYDQIDLLRCIDMLMRHDDVGYAGEIWRKHINSTPLFYNGDFSERLLNRAFGWKKIKSTDVDQSIRPVKDSGGINNLHVRFKGWNNVYYHHIFQTVPLSQGRYLLSAKVKTRKLTTDQRPYLEVFGYNCEGMDRSTSEMFSADQAWEKVSVNFIVPPQCSAAVIRIRRDESRQIDSKISGSIWLTDVAVDSVDNVDKDLQ